MFDARALLDQFLGAGSAPAAGGQKAKGGDDLLGRARAMLEGNPALSGGASGAASGAVTGALAAMLMGSKKGRKGAVKAAQIGGLALLGGLAYKAYRDYQSGKTAAPAPAPAGGSPWGSSAPVPLPPPADSPFAPPRVEATGLPVTLLRTMVAAALADGHLDDAERAALSERALTLGGDAEAFLAREIARPASVEALAAAAPTVEAAAEVYLAALVTIDPDTIAERAFLARLGTALKLDPALASHLEAAAREAKAEA